MFIRRRRAGGYAVVCMRSIIGKAYDILSCVSVSFFRMHSQIRYVFVPPVDGGLPKGSDWLRALVAWCVVQMHFSLTLALRTPALILVLENLEEEEDDAGLFLLSSTWYGRDNGRESFFSLWWSAWNMVVLGSFVWLTDYRECVLRPADFSH